MSIKTIRHRLLYLKDGLQGLIYVALAKKSWFISATPVLAFIIRPLLGITLTTLALLQLWNFSSYVANKNLDIWMSSVGALTSALLNNVAAFGGLIARATGTVFTAGPWFFVAGFAVGALYQLIMAGVNGRRAYESPTSSNQRQHYVQGAGYNIITAFQLASCASAIVLFNVLPAFTGLITAVALTVVVINTANSLWRFLSSDIKKDIKNGIGIGKPEQESSQLSLGLLGKMPLNDQPPQNVRRLFTSCDHSAVIRPMSISAMKEYLLDTIRKKINELTQKTPSKTNQQKITVLKHLEHTIIEQHIPHKGTLHKSYPLIVRNFWCEKSDTDQIIDAVTYYANYCKMHEELGSCATLHMK